MGNLSNITPANLYVQGAAGYEIAPALSTNLRFVKTNELTDNDIWEFENHSWIFSTVTFFIFLTLLLFYLKYKSKDKKAKWLNLIITSTLYSLVFTICLNRTTNRAMLYLNTNFHNKTLKQEYIIQRYDTNNVFQLFAKIIEESLELYKS